MAADLNNHHRDTLTRIFEHPASANVEWHAVRSLLDTVASTTEEHNGKLKVSLGDETIVFHPHGKDVDEQTLVDLRRLLRDGGFAPA